MKILKRIIFVLFLIIAAGGMICIKTSAAEKNNIPKVVFVGVDHSPLVEGDKETFYITSEYSDKVKYKVLLYSENEKKWEALTENYSEPVDADTPYTISPDKVFKKGKYKLSIWVKAENSSNEYDSTYTAYLNCVDRDDSCRVYANDEMDIDKSDYLIGEKVTVRGIKNISGMKGPYKYKLHIYNISTGEWKIDDLGYRDTIEWTPDKPGKYVLDIWAISSDSTLWAKINKNPNEKLYESWKLKVITVSENTSSNSNITVCLDPGHGGSDRYNTGNNGYVEADGTLDIALKVREILESNYGIKVVMTRDRDMTVELADRVKIINDSNCDIAVSIHTNAGPEEAKGSEDYYSINSPVNEKGYKLAHLIIDYVTSYAETTNRGARTKKSSSEPTKDYYYIIRNSVPVSTIVECAFHTNPEDVEKLNMDEYRFKFAEGIARGIVEYFGIQWIEPSSIEPSPEDPTSSQDQTVLYKVFLNDQQKGAFRNLDNAVKLAEQLYNQVQSGSVKIITSNGETIYNEQK